MDRKQKGRPEGWGRLCQTPFTTERSRKAGTQMHPVNKARGRRVPPLARTKSQSKQPQKAAAMKNPRQIQAILAKIWPWHEKWMETNPEEQY